MKLNKLPFSALLIIALFASCQRYTDENDFEIKVLDDNTIEITGYKGKSKDVRIPPRINNMPVTVIGYIAFAKKELTRVTIPNSVTEIGLASFSSNNLTRVIIPNSVITICNDAFNSNALKHVTIPNSVTEIGWSSFAHNNLTKIIIPNSVTSIEGYAFSDNKLTSVIIPEGVECIEASSFENNNLTEVVIPNSVTSMRLGWNAFKGNDIKRITIGDNVDIHYDTFPAEFVSFYNLAFRKKGGTYIFTDRWIPEDKNNPVLSFSSILLDDNKSVISILKDMPDLEELELYHEIDLVDITPLSRLTKLKDLTIIGCPNIETLEPLSSLTNLETILLDECPKIESLEPLSSLAKLETIIIDSYYGFQYGYSKIKSLEPLLSLANLSTLQLGHENNFDYGKLASLHKLEKLKIFNRENDKEIDLSQIGKLNSLKNLNISGKLKIFNPHALQNLTNLEKLIISVIDIEDVSWIPRLSNQTKIELVSCTFNNINPLAAFPNLNNVELTDIRFKDEKSGFTFTYIYDSHDRGIIIHYDELELTGYRGKEKNIRIPSQFQGISVFGIDTSAFAEKQLISVIIPNGIRYIGYEAFRGNQLTSISIPKSVEYIGKRAFSNNQLESIEILNSEINIGYEAFKDNKIVKIKLPANIHHNDLRFINSISPFDEYYKNNGSKAGTYTFINGLWVFKE